MEGSDGSTSFMRLYLFGRTLGFPPSAFPVCGTSVTRFGGHSGPAPHSKFTPLKGGPVVISDFANLNWPEGSHRGRRELSLAVVVPPVVLAWPPVVLAWPSSSRPSSSPGRRDLWP